ncbi:uncharacterized protein LOC143025906 [Oratosquilla oratoria]|uniref:uncharacterized protein LOC143025906 n=1 Tax=Oratosquilla oratoria TaxID=337810 RepID=UPI003F759349
MTGRITAASLKDESSDLIEVILPFGRSGRRGGASAQKLPVSIIADAAAGSSKSRLTALQKHKRKILSLGLNCHLQPTFNREEKVAESELLLHSLLQLQTEDKITEDQASRELRNNPELIIRRVKFSIYVLLNEDEYFSKIDHILSDTSKFKKISSDPTSKLNVKVNDLIPTNIAASVQLHTPPIVGEFSPGYMYGNVKTHKPNCPHRPIISQIPTPTHRLSKQLDNIITPYMPKKYSSKSINEFLDIIQSKQPQGVMTSLDVQILFTYVPVLQTVDIILNNVFRHPELPSPKITKRNILKKLLLARATEAPFRDPSGQLYYQVEGVAMGSPLGCTFADFYLCHLENKILQNSDLWPFTYCRYVDDIFVEVRSESHLIELQQAMESSSVLKFTYELSLHHKIPFLDVLISSEDDQYQTTVYRKKTDIGRCLNAASECPQRYKLSVIRAYLRRAFRNCSSWTLFHQELSRIKQILSNNGYSNTIIDNKTRIFMTRILAQQKQNHPPSKHLVCYKNQMTPA